MKYPERKDILGVGFDDVDMREALDRALEMAKHGSADYIVTPNSEIVYACRTDDIALSAVNGASMVIPDGVGVVYASKILGRSARLKCRVPGVELGDGLLPMLAENALSLFLLGGKPGIAENAAKNLTQKYPALKICGIADGYFKDSDEAAAAIKSSGADVAYVCLGAPAQECWMARYGADTGAKLLCGLGGSIDIYAGKTERAPEKWRKLGLEWLYRFFKDPSRIGRMMRLPKFIFLAIFARIVPALRVPPVQR